MKTKGIYLSILTALISGISIFINKYAVGSIQPPLVFTAVKNSFVALFIFAILIAFKKNALIKNLNRHQLISLLLIGLIGGSLPFYLYFNGLSQIPAINGAIIHKTLVVWVAFLAIPLLGEKLSKLQIVGVTLLFFSNLLIGGFPGFKFSSGELMVLAATILWAIENVIAKKILPDVDPDIVTAARLGLGSLVLLVAAAITYPRALSALTHFHPNQWLWLLATAIALFFYTITWYRALKFAPATLVTSILVASTLVTNILSAIFVTHNLFVLMTIPNLALALGFSILLWSSIRSSLAPQELTS